MASTDDPQRPVYGALVTPEFTRDSNTLASRILCLTGLGAVATLIDEALSAGFADAASTAIPAHSEAKATPLLETCSASVEFLRGFQRAPAESPAGNEAGNSSECPGFATRQEVEAEQGSPASPEVPCKLLG